MFICLNLLRLSLYGGHQGVLFFVVVKFNLSKLTFPKKALILLIEMKSKVMLESN